MAEKPEHVLTLIERDDWVRVYADGEYMGEGHSVDSFGGQRCEIHCLTDILEMWGIKTVSHWPDDPEEELFLVGTDEEFSEMEREVREQDARDGGYAG